VIGAALKATADVCFKLTFRFGHMSHAERDGKQWNETTNETADSSETDSNELQMHKLLLHLRPRQYEQAFADEVTSFHPDSAGCAGVHISK
jgi:hypothetical protein